MECLRRNRAGLPPLALVFATIHRRGIDLARHEDRRANREQVVAVDETTPWFGTGVEDREFNQVIRRALADLPGEQREVIMLKIGDELTFAEISQSLGIPANIAAALSVPHDRTAEIDETGFDMDE